MVRQRFGGEWTGKGMREQTRKGKSQMIPVSMNVALEPA